jgi:hypothetical protein
MVWCEHGPFIIDIRFVLSLDVIDHEATCRCVALINNWVIGDIVL